jgi:hypothetical protein
LQRVEDAQFAVARDERFAVPVLAYGSWKQRVLYITRPMQPMG